MKDLITNLDKILRSKSTDRTEYVEAIQEIEKFRKLHALAKNEKEANLCWMYKSILEIHELFLGVFEKIKSNKHMDAWVDLERWEIAISILEKNRGSKRGQTYTLDTGCLPQSKLCRFDPGCLPGLKPANQRQQVSAKTASRKARPRRCTTKSHIKG